MVPLPHFCRVVVLHCALMWICALTWNLPAVTSADQGSGEVDFRHDIRPLLSDHCFACHGPDPSQRQADLRLDQDRQQLIDRQVIVPHDPSASLLLQRLTTDDPDMRMPPEEHGKALTPTQIAQIERWIQQGADWQGHWAFLPPQRHTAPSVDDHAWPRNIIDHFVLARLQVSSRDSSSPAAQGRPDPNEQEASDARSLPLHPSPPADRATLLRRLCLDLTGLPPTPQQLNRYLPTGKSRGSFEADEYEQLVDRLLRSPHFGERMALAWMDQARYADTNGYSIDGGRHMWVWRDWVINAYNENMPFDQFLVEQLAGDLLPNASVDQRVATAFNRNHMITHEGGTIPEENLVNYVADRVRTTGEVFLGLTVGCAQCHDHKFDPITQRDYYRLFAYFNTVGDRGLDGNAGRNAQPSIRVTSVFGRDPAVIETMKAELEQLEVRYRQPLPSQENWERRARKQLRQRGQDLQLYPVHVLNVTSPNRGAKYHVAKDGTVWVPGSSGRSPSISARLPRQQLNGKPVTGLRMVFSPHDELPQQGLGHGNDNGLPGSFLLTALLTSATSVPSEQVDLFKQLSARRVTASAAHADHPPAACLDHRDHNGWSPHPQNQMSQSLTFEFQDPLDASKTPYVTVMMVFGGGPYGGGAGLTAGQYRLYAMTGTNDQTDLPQDIRQILPVAPGQRTAAQVERIRKYHASIAPEYTTLRYRIQNLRERIEHMSQPQDVMVMNVADDPRQTHVLNRGQYDQPLEPVQPGIPEQLKIPELDEQSLPPNRLGLARWMVHSQHPLTARVAVNRLWQLLMGEGLVRSSADFGSQGTPPTHPQLLDTLAVEFIESGWDVKRLVKRIVMSATYRQSSRVTPAHRRIDPGNRLLARAPRFRLPAELVRDNALAIAGRLDLRLGGPSVRPYQPPNLWKEVSHFGSTPATAQTFAQDHADRLYRRSLYTYWKRTAPPPSMLAFDAPNREICTVKRSSTNTPLQALVLLNDPQFVEASRLFAERILQHGGNDDTSRLRFAFRLATTRMPCAEELQVLKRTLARERKRFDEHSPAAEKLLAVGESPRAESFTPAEHAAWTSVASLILNLSETVTRG